MGDSNEKAFEIFVGRVLENFKGKEHGSIKLKKGATVTVLGLSADGDKYFGEVGKQRGWFPSEYVLKTGVPAIAVDESHLSNHNSKSAESPTRSKRSATSNSQVYGELSTSADSIRTGPSHLRKHSGPTETSAPKIAPPSLGDLKKGSQGLSRRATQDILGHNTLPKKFPPPSPSAFNGSTSNGHPLPTQPSPQKQPPQPSQVQLTVSEGVSVTGGGGSGGGSTTGGAPVGGVSGATSARTDLESRKKTFQQQGASGRMFLSMGPTLGFGTRSTGGGGGGDVADFVKNRKKSMPGVDALLLAGEEESKKAKKELKKMMKEKKKEEKNAKKHKKKAHKTKLVYFGVSLEETMTRQKENYPDLQYPLMLTSLCNAITQLDGPNTEGIFRISGTQSVLDELKYQLDKDNQVRIEDAHVATGLLKLWLGMLPEPLVPPPYHEKCFATVEAPEESVKVLEDLPEINRKVITYLIHFLQEKILPSETTTRMNAENLAMVMAPTLFVASDESSAPTSVGGLGDLLRQTGQGIRFVHNLLTTMKFSAPLDFETDKKKLDLLIGVRGKVKDKPKVKLGLASPRAKVEKHKHERRNSAPEEREKEKEKDKDKEKDKETEEGGDTSPQQQQETPKESGVVSGVAPGAGGAAVPEKTHEKQKDEEKFSFG